ncbi:uncharacterized protein LOC124358190 [Homalodisca vitripennis]|uniref:uncharacterized protein LOC124355322 n=1 Tax=Homalodisca vitripennis TaxID=197043 RepID=UPI001EEA9740|nr:uncharacterized protein LOC124355322 [Homalodisca vitripennis]XP_046666441.1 uncharacterized protein LOC124358190 [Homalodisca vitripennis]
MTQFQSADYLEGNQLFCTFQKYSFHSHFIVYSNGFLLVLKKRLSVPSVTIKISMEMETNELLKSREKARLRKQRSREKKKTNKEAWEKSLKKDAERKRISRAKEKEKLVTISSTSAGKKELKLKRCKETERKRKYRLKQKEKLEHVCDKNNELGTFSNRQSLGKAVVRAKKFLPKSPSKKLAVVRKLVYENFQLPKSDRFFIKEHVEKKTVLSKETEEKVIAFYSSDTVSRQAPGKRDYKTVKSKVSGEKEKLQIRHMVMTVKEAYALFVEENPGIGIKKSKFYSLRPIHIRLSSEMPHNVCVCKLHANFNFLTESLSKAVVGFPPTGKELLAAICCNITSEACMTESCNKCKDTNFLTKFSLNIDLEAQISWKQWGEVNKRPVITYVETTIGEAMEMVQNMLGKFKVHCYIKNVQSEYFEYKKKNATQGEAVLQIDFAENYSCIAQDEIQSAHWSNTLVTIFTGVAWVPNGKQCYALISNNLTHDKFSIWYFLKKIISDLKQQFKIEEVAIFSDGCAGQFKNRYTLSNLTFLDKDYQVTGEWCFFATSHGKGAVDGVGGTVKRMVWEQVKSRRTTVTSAEEFFECCQKQCEANKIKVMYVDVKDIEECQELLESRWAAVRPIPKVQSMHYLRASTLYPGSIVAGNTVKSELQLSESWNSHDESINEKLSDEDSLDSDFLTENKKVQYLDVYSSEDEDSYLRPKPLKKDEIEAGQYILVELVSEGKQKRAHKYLAITQGCVEEDNNVEVLFMRLVQKTKTKDQLFEIDSSKTYIVSVSEIQGVFEGPEVKELRNSIYYKFAKSIEL